MGLNQREHISKFPHYFQFLSSCGLGQLDQDFLNAAFYLLLFIYAREHFCSPAIGNLLMLKLRAERSGSVFADDLPLKRIFRRWCG